MVARGSMVGDLISTCYFLSLKVDFSEMRAHFTLKCAHFTLKCTKQLISSQVSWELVTEGYQGRPIKCVHFETLMVILWLKILTVHSGGSRIYHRGGPWTPEAATF